jgi:hypothetical protein
MSKFAETAAANLFLQTSISPGAALGRTMSSHSGGRCRAILHDHARPFMRERMRRMCGYLLLSHMGESHAAGRLLD